MTSAIFVIDCYDQQVRATVRRIGVEVKVGRFHCLLVTAGFLVTLLSVSSTAPGASAEPASVGQGLPAQLVQTNLLEVPGPVVAAPRHQSWLVPRGIIPLAQVGVIEPPLDVVVPTVADGTLATGSTSVADQSVRFEFDGTVGQRVVFKAGAVGAAAVELFDPKGVRIASESNNLIGNILRLDVAGKFHVVVTPVQPTLQGTSSARVWTVPPDAVAPVTMGGPAAAASMTTPRQSLRFTFAGVAGQRVYLRLTQSTVVGVAQVYVQTERGNRFASGGFAAEGVLGPVTLPESGIISMFVFRYDELMSTVTASVSLSADNVVTDVQIDGPPVTAAATTLGQDICFRFSGTAGQRIVILSTIANGSGNVYDDIGTNTIPPTYMSFYLNRTGTHCFEVQHVNGHTFPSATVQIRSVPQDLLLPISLGGAAVVAASSSRGQRIRFTFDGTAGQTLSLQTSNSLPNSTYAWLLDTVGNSTIFSGPLTTLTLGRTGRHTIMFTNDGDVVGTVSAQVSVTGVLPSTKPPDITTSAVVDGPTASVTTTSAGQDALFTFPGVAGQRVYIATTAPFVKRRLFAPDGSELGHNVLLSIPADAVVGLPTTGTYVLAIDYSENTIGVSTVKISTVPPDTISGFVPDGSTSSAATTAPGQTAMYTLNATAGQRIFLRSTSPSSVRTIVGPDAERTPPGSLRRHQ